MSLASDSSNIARDQQARSRELCTACDLTRLWAQQGRGVEALRLLQAIHNHFDSAELKRAEALQVELDASAQKIARGYQISHEGVGRLLHRNG